MLAKSRPKMHLSDSILLFRSWKKKKDIQEWRLAYLCGTVELPHAESEASRQNTAQNLYISLLYTNAHKIWQHSKVYFVIRPRIKKHQSTWYVRLIKFPKNKTCVIVSLLGWYVTSVSASGSANFTATSVYYIDGPQSWTLLYYWAWTQAASQVFNRPPSSSPLLLFLPLPFPPPSSLISSLSPPLI